MTEARNMFQHGHFIVSKDVEGKCSFDFNQLTTILHYNLRDDKKRELSDLQRQMNELTYYEKPANLSFTHTLDLYCLSISKIYYGYYYLANLHVKSLVKEAIKIQKAHPQMILKKEETGTNFDLLFCNIIDGTGHGIEIDYAFYIKFKGYKREAFDEMNYFNEISYTNTKNKNVAPLYKRSLPTNDNV